MYDNKIAVSRFYFPREITEKDFWRTFIQILDPLTMYKPIRNVIWIQEITKDTLESDLKNLILIVWAEEDRIIVEQINRKYTPKKPLRVQDLVEENTLITYP